MDTSYFLLLACLYPDLPVLNAGFLALSGPLRGLVGNRLEPCACTSTLGRHLPPLSLFMGAPLLFLAPQYMGMGCVGWGCSSFVLRLILAEKCRNGTAPATAGGQGRMPCRFCAVRPLSY